MAERSPRYRRRIALPNVPQIDYVSAGRAQAAAAGSIVNALDRMADFAIKKLEVEQFEFGIENAPTVAQAEQAIATGSDLGLPTGDVAQAAAVSVLNNNMETSIRQKMANLAANPKTQDMSPSEYAVELNALVDGYASVLDETVSKQAGAKFRARMSTFGNQQYAAFLKNRSKDELENRRKSDFEAANQIIDGFPAILDGDIVVGEDGHITTPIDVINDGIERIYGLSNLKATEAQTLAKTAQEAKINAISQHVADWVVTDPAENIRLALAGQSSDFNIQNMLDELSPVDRRRVVKMATSQVEENEKIIRDQDNAVERRMLKRTNDLQAAAVDAYNRDDDEALPGIMSELRATNLSVFNETDAAMRKQGGVDDPEVLDALIRHSARGELTLSQLIAYRGRMSRDTFAKYAEKVAAQGKDDHRVAMDKFRATLGISKSALTVDKLKGQKLAIAEDALNMAARRDPELDRVAFAENYVNTVLTEQLKADQERARKEIEAAKERANIGPGEETDQQFVDYVLSRENDKTYYRRQTGRLRTLGLMNE